MDVQVKSHSSGTIRTNLSDATLVTSKSVLPTPINYLVPIQTPIPPSNNTTITLATPRARASTEKKQMLPLVTMTIPTSTDDAQDLSLIFVPPSSEEEGPNNRLEESNKN